MSSYMRQSFSRGAIPTKSLFGSEYFIGQTLVFIIFESVVEKKNDCEKNSRFSYFKRLNHHLLHL
jgi:hypothetical protein